MTAQQRITDLGEAVLILVFLIGLGAPVFLGLTQGSTFEPQRENREPANRPKRPSDWDALAVFPEEFEAFFEDSYGLRKDLIQLHSRLQLNLFQHSKNKRVIVGRDGWLYLGHRRTTAYSRAEVPLTFEQLETYRIELEGHRDWMTEHGIAFVPFIAPIKHSIYPEYLPDSQLPQGRVRRKQQVLEHLAKYSDLEFLDLAPALLAERSRARLFHKTDSHWNYRGAFVGYRAVLEHCTAIDPSLTPFAESLLSWRTKTTSGMDLASLLRLSDELVEEQFMFDAPGLPKYERISTGLCEDCGIPPSGLMVTASEDSSRPRAVAFGDSFFGNLAPFFAPHFSRLVRVPSHRINRLLLAHEKPDVVFLEVVERQFMFPKQLLSKP